MTQSNQSFAHSDQEAVLASIKEMITQTKTPSPSQPEDDDILELTNVIEMGHYTRPSNELSDTPDIDVLTHAIDELERRIDELPTHSVLQIDRKTLKSLAQKTIQQWVDAELANIAKTCIDQKLNQLLKKS